MIIPLWRNNETFYTVDGELFDLISTKLFIFLNSPNLITLLFNSAFHYFNIITSTRISLITFEYSVCCMRWRGKTYPTPNLSVRKTRVETRRTSHVQAKKRLFERIAKWIRVRRVAVRRGAASYFANAAATNPSDEVHEFTARGSWRGRKKDARRKKKPRRSHSVECTDEFTPYNRAAASSSSTVLQPYDYSKLRKQLVQPWSSAGIQNAQNVMFSMSCALDQIKFMSLSLIFNI